MQRRKTGNVLIKQVLSSEFKVFFKEKMLPVLYPIETERKKILEQGKFFSILAVIISIALGFGVYIVCDGNHRNMTDILEIYLFIAGGLCVMGFGYAPHMFKKLSQAKIMPLLFEFFPNINPTKYDTYKIRDVISGTRFFNRYDSIEVDDAFEGTYNDLAVKIAETEISYRTTSHKGRSRKVTVFNGLFFAISMNKNFKSKTLIKKDAGVLNSVMSSGYERVALEDVEFEKLFEVYSEDQIEARYLLTTAFMERFKKIKQKYGDKLEAVFYENHLYLFLSSAKDYFDVPHNKDIAMISHYQAIIIELAEILSICDTLKLEQNIGL